MVPLVRHGGAELLSDAVDESARMGLGGLDLGRNVPNMKDDVVARGTPMLGGGPFAEAAGDLPIGRSAEAE
jgi:hypothetical protein